MSKLKAIDKLNSLTKPGEVILWTGAPAKGINFPPFRNSSPLYFHGFGVVILFALSIIQPFFLFWALPFLLVLTINIIRYFLIRRTIIYRVTNQRIIIFSDFISQSLRQIDIKSLKELNLHIHRNGTGTITFNKSSWYPLPYWSVNPMYSLTPPKFESINSPSDVYEIVNSLSEIPASGKL